MMEVYPALPKFMVQECQDEDDLTDIDDEVFIRDGKNGGLKLDEDGVVKRPLMAPRKKYRKFYKVRVDRFPYKTLFIPICYGLIALVILLGLIVLCIYTANIFPLSFTMIKKWISHELIKPSSVSKMHVIPCTSLSSKIIWSRRISKFSSILPLRIIDVNNDGIDDIIAGFSTGAIEKNTAQCYDFTDDSGFCLSQILALDGKTGDTLWIYWTNYAISSIDCGMDITNDKTNDCIASGEDGILHAINGKTGIKIWHKVLSLSEHSTIFHIFDAKFITDTDRDGIGDIIATGYTFQSDLSRNSKILIISGKKGKILYTIDSPKIELFSLPQTIVYPDGENIFVLTANNQMQSGTLYIASSTNFMHGNLKLKELHHSTGKAALLPLVLADITLDGIADIIASMFDSTIIAYDGLTFNQIWNYTVPNSEILSSPIPGYYNDDEIPDFMIKHKVENEGFPKYYYTVSMIIDGDNGQPLLEKPIEDILNKQLSGLSITVDGFGNDWFLHWSGNCLHDEDIKGTNQFSKKTNLPSETRADSCKMKLNSTSTIKLLALSQLVEPPGITLYSEEYELNNSIEIEKEIEEYLKLYHYEDRIDIDTGKIYKDYDKEEIFKHNRDEDIIDESANYHQKPFKMTYANRESNFEGDNRFDNNFQMSNMENIDNDNSLYHKNKNLENIKEYDESDERNNDYLPIGDLREKRRQVNNNDQTNNVINDKHLFSSQIRNKRNKKSNNILNKSMNYSKQRQQSSGILLPSFIDSKEGNSIDLIFTTSGWPLLETYITLSQEDLKCMYRNKLSSKNNIHRRKNADIIKECLNERDDIYNLFEKTIKQDNIIIPLGQMTVHRMKLECVCPEDMLPNQVCKSIASKQSWSEYLGLYSSGYFRPLHKNT